MKALVIDFETVDPYIGMKLGSGWVYGYNYRDASEFTVLGCAYKSLESDSEPVYTTDWDEVKRVVDEHDTIIMHNAQYDIGCLFVIGIDVKDKTIYDTEVLARLHNNTLPSFSLAELGSKYLGKAKLKNALGNAVWEAGIYPWLKRELAAKEKEGDSYVREKPPQEKLNKFAITNMDLLQEADYDTVAKYAKRDVELTADLFNYYSTGNILKLGSRYSYVQYICADIRKRGVRIDIDRAKQVEEVLAKRIDSLFEKVYEIAGREFNINSATQVAEVLDDHGIKYPTTAKGNPSVTTPWMDKQNDPICTAIKNVRKFVKIKNEFIDKIIDIAFLEDNPKYGRIYPELNLFRARTGRFSCIGPNLQQIPARDPQLGPLCRSIYVPEEGTKWYSLDFSNQEGRLQVHYAYLLKCEGADELHRLFHEDPNLDMHGKVADMVGIPRQQAKVVNLGISYGMGLAKLAESLQITKAQAKIVRDNYNTLAPFLADLNDACQNAMKRKGFIKTIGGRHSKMDPPTYVDGKKNTFEYRALNRLIQGSAADQTIEAMVQLYEAGINILFPVHDQFCIFSNDPEDAKRAKHIMETAIELSIPMVVDLDEDGGDNWANAGH